MSTLLPRAACGAERKQPDPEAAAGLASVRPRASDAGLAGRFLVAAERAAASGAALFPSERQRARRGWGGP